MSELILFSNKAEANLFRAIGFRVHIVRDEEEIEEILKETKNDVKVIAFDVTFTRFFNEYSKNQKDLYPLYLSLPLSDDDSGKTINEMKENIRKSIGIDLL